MIDPSLKPTFAIIGAAGYVARKHAAAIRAVGGEILAVVDPHDAVGWLDEYAPNASYYRDLAAFIPRAMDVQFAAICTPNDLHAGQAMALVQSAGCSVIVEKPVALGALELERMLPSVPFIHPILNARCSSEAVRLREFAASRSTRSSVTVRYFAPRGDWYYKSWKGDLRRSGGIVTNIGIHVLDLLLWSFGPLKSVGSWKNALCHAEGRLALERADVEISLMTDTVEPERSVTVDGERFDLGNLACTHEESYRRILAGTGWKFVDAMPSVMLCERLGFYR